jgi:lipoate-protein ligase A
VSKINALCPVFFVKVGGNAQTITKGRWVHHTSFLWQFDPSRMGYLKVRRKATYCA